jgi:hypothetical protein
VDLCRVCFIAWLYIHCRWISSFQEELVLLVEETGVSSENLRPVASQWQALSHNVVSSTPRLSGIRTHNVSGNRHWLQITVNNGDYSSSNIIFSRYNITFCLFSIMNSTACVSKDTPVSSTNKTDRYDITESDVKHHKPNPSLHYLHNILYLFYTSTISTTSQLATITHWPCNCFSYYSLYW